MAGQFFVDTIYITGTGLNTTTCGFQPVGAEIETVRSAFNNNFSRGTVDSSGWTAYNYNYRDGAGADSDARAGQEQGIVHLMGRPSSTIVPVNTAVYDTSLGCVMNSTQFKFYVTLATVPSLYIIKIWG